MNKLILIAVLTTLGPSTAFAKLNVITSTQDLASIAQEIGKDHTEIYAIAKGYQDPHYLDAKPSYLLKLRKADLLIVVGLELEVSWLPPLLTSARNAKIMPDGSGFLDASVGCEILQKPTGPIDRSMGDIHPFGNPHYWMSPENGRVIARAIAARLVTLDAVHAGDYQKNLADFETRLTAKQKEWTPFPAIKAVTYHNCYPYFAKAFGLQVVNHVEPNPGIPPSPAHIQKVIQQIKSEKVPLILMDPYFDERIPQKIAREGGAQLLIFPASVGGDPSIKTYFDLFDYNLGLIRKALSTGGKS